jgi:hypothetical protein
MGRFIHRKIHFRFLRKNVSHNKRQAMESPGFCSVSRPDQSRSSAGTGASLLGALQRSMVNTTLAGAFAFLMVSVTAYKTWIQHKFLQAKQFMPPNHAINPTMLQRRLALFCLSLFARWMSMKPLVAC